MNACHPKKYALPGFDSRQAERTTQRQPPPYSLHLLRTKLLSSTSMVAAYLPMPVSSYSKISMTSSVSLVRWRPSWQIRVMRVVSTLRQKTYSNNVSFKLPLAMKMRTMPTPCATIPSANSSSIGCPKLVPPWPHSRRYHALKTVSHALRFIAWL